MSVEVMQPESSAGLADPRVKPLKRMQALALGLLVSAALGLVVSELMGGMGAWGWVRAFCEAAVVGALADWFAVVALFRRPMGLPIPHTAIIPSSKERIADSLAVFVRDHFLDHESLLSKLSVFNPAVRMGDWLTQPENVRKLTGSVRVIAQEALGMLDEHAVRRAIHDFVVTKVRAWDAAATGGDVLNLLTKDGRHHELLDGALMKFGEYLQDPDNKRKVAGMMVAYARKEWPKIIVAVNMVKSVDALADDFADRLANALIEEMSEALASPEHAVRVKYEAWLYSFVGRLKADAVLRGHINEIKEKAVQHPAVHDYVNGIWEEIRSALESELKSADSALVRHMEQCLLGLGNKLSQDEGLRAAINAHVLSAADKLADNLRTTVTGHISQTVKAWDDHQLVQQIELSVGRDLQFIRINGTVVGGAVGLALHALLVLVVPLLR
jgi:uncharacterized membrane-anchored protein YjiN (DUF445 family)